MLSPHPRPEDLAGFYPPVYNFTPDLGKRSFVKRLLAGLENRLFFQLQYGAQTRLVLKGIRWDGRPGLRLLDVGCGRGLRLLAFRARGFDVCGADLLPESVEYLRKQLQIPAACCDFPGLETAFAPQSFDVITAFCVLEHIPDVRKELARCLRLLRPGGWFVGVVPMLDGLQAAYLGRRWVNVTEAPRHLSLPTREGMRRACQAAGYEEVSLRADSVLQCAALVGLSLFPGCATTHLYGGDRVRSLILRVLAGATSLLALPWCMIENHVLRRPGHAMLFARRPRLV
jgi:SAM-dependent methyltransferase